MTTLPATWRYRVSKGSHGLQMQKWYILLALSLHLLLLFRERERERERERLAETNDQSALPHRRCDGQRQRDQCIQTKMGKVDTYCPFQVWLPIVHYCYCRLICLILFIVFTNSFSCLFFCLSVCLSICVSIYPSVYLFIFLFIYWFM